MESDTSRGMTVRLADFIANTRSSEVPSRVIEHAKVAFLDWVGVAMAGKDDPLVLKLIRFADRMGGREQAVILGHGMRKTISQAALINGAASHALDYDDSLISFLGHPSVTIFPGILALGEFTASSGLDFLSAYAVGLRVGVSIAASAGLEHYLSGYHGTSTMGTLASAAACARLLGLNENQTAHALGIAGTQAGGLKRVFGTMCKPFHAGRASDVGVCAAVLAEDGFTSAEDILEGPGGFFQAMKGSVNEESLASLGQTWLIETLAQKYHASCHATHSPIEAALSIVKENDVPIADIASITVRTSETALSAAFRKEARTGLEGKFSIPYCVANALIRGNTGLQAFTDEMVGDANIQELMSKIKTVQDPAIQALDADVELVTAQGDVFSKYIDIFKEIPDLETKQRKIKLKYEDLCEPVIGRKNTKELYDGIRRLEHMNSLSAILAYL
ncbi:MAG: MmgE/PrpD family protein [Desulfobacterales bacterium]